MTPPLAPWAGNSHEVSGKFLEHNFDLLVHRFSLDAREGGVRHLGLDTVGRDSIGHDDSI